MSKKLEHFISKNRQHFDHETPSDQVWFRIKKSIQIRGVNPIWRIAAVFLFFTSSILLIRQEKFFESKAQEVLRSDNFPEAEIYYNNQIKQREEWLNEANSEASYNFSAEYDRMISMYQVLKMELDNNPSPRIEDAIILNQIVRLDLLNKQLDANGLKTIELAYNR